MQTFLPYADFETSAQVLDYRRLGNQRKENIQIIKALYTKEVDIKYGWQNHPATLMWEEHLPAFLEYHKIIVSEWKGRGYKDNGTVESFLEYYDKLTDIFIYPADTPPVVGREQFHASHRSNLLRKDPEYYSKFGWSEPDNLDYIWA